jgi:protein SCO1/2
MNRRSFLTLTAGSGLLLAARDVAAHSTTGRYTPPADGDALTEKVAVLNVPLVDQFGEERRLFSDIIGDRVAIVNFIFTRCTTVCPLNTAILAEVEAMLGDRAGEDIVLVSISTDPEYDTPARMKAFADQFGASTDWAFLTGEAFQVEAVLGGFRAFVADPADHTSAVLVGRASDEYWATLDGFPDPQAIVDAALAAGPKS